MKRGLKGDLLLVYHFKGKKYSLNEVLSGFYSVRNSMKILLKSEAIEIQGLFFSGKSRNASIRTSLKKFGFSISSAWLFF